MSIANPYQAPQSSPQTNTKTSGLIPNSAYELQPLMKGARLSYGAEALISLGFMLTGWCFIAAILVQNYALLFFRKTSPASGAVPLLTAALGLFSLGTLCFASFVFALLSVENTTAQLLSLTSLLLWGAAFVALLLGLVRIGNYVAQPSVCRNAKLAMLMLALTYVVIGIYYFLSFNPLFLVNLELVSDQKMELRCLDVVSAVSWVLAAIGMGFYSKSVSRITRLAELQLAERASKTDFTAIDEVQTVERGHEMDFLKM